MTGPWLEICDRPAQLGSGELDRPAGLLGLEEDDLLQETKKTKKIETEEEIHRNTDEQKDEQMAVDYYII